MAEMKDVHIVEIPVDEEHQSKQLITAMQNHPLAEISRSPGHLLLLKLWQREEDLCSRRVACKESRLDSTKQDIFHLCCFFLLFHALFTVLVFTSSVSGTPTCGRWWIPSLVSLSTSLVFVLLVHGRVCRYWKVWRQLSRERADGRAITRCIQELRMKGSSFDLSKEPLHIGKKLKSSSVEVKWKPLNWSGLSNFQAAPLHGPLFPRPDKSGASDNTYGVYMDDGPAEFGREQDRESRDPSISRPDESGTCDKTYGVYMSSKGMKHLVRLSLQRILPVPGK